MNGLVFDAGGLIALERNDRRVYSLIETVRRSKGRLRVPSTALAQVLRSPARQARLARLISDRATEVVALDRKHAQAVGLLLAESGTTDIVYAHVVICAQMSGFAVMTSDIFDLRRLDPQVHLIAI